MRILILGGNGMIGHKIYQRLSKKYPDTWVTLRNKLFSYKFREIYNSQKVIDQIDLTNFNLLKFNLDELNPDVIINASGITLRRGIDNSRSTTIILNSVLPHFLNEWVSLNKKKLIHFSTDCVFSGEKGNYNDIDFKDAFDLYGSSKALGEITDSRYTLTLRGSMIGREIENKTELLEWFLKQKNKKINGYSEVIYSGITTVKMAEIILTIIDNNINLHGVYNVSSIPITKFDLLNLCNDHFEINATIEKNNTYKSNKNLISNLFFNEINLNQPNWTDLIKQLIIDSRENYNLYN